MFYCEPCGYNESWPTDLLTPTSRGTCEVCHDYGVCFDVPSKFLHVTGKPADPWAEIIPGEAAAIESIKSVPATPSAATLAKVKCSACGTHGVPHAVNDEFCRDMQHERVWKNMEEA